MQISEYAVIINVISYGENGYIASVFTETYGILKGFVRQNKNKKNINFFTVGNAIKMTYFGREGTMGTISGERYKLYTYSCIESKEDTALILAICEYIKIAFGHIEHQGSGNLFQELIQCLDIVKSTNYFDKKVFYFSIFVKHLLEFCGYGFRLKHCIATGNDNIDDLVFISPKSATSVSEDAGFEYKHLMFSLPKCFITEKYEDIKNELEALQCLKIVDFFINKNFHQMSTFVQFLLAK